MFAAQSVPMKHVFIHTPIRPGVYAKSLLLLPELLQDLPPSLLKFRKQGFFLSLYFIGKT